MTPKRSFFSYDQESLVKAVQDVQRGELSKKAASIKYNIPRSTLIRKLSGAVPLERKMGHDTVLTKAEEGALSDWVVAMARKGFPISRSQLLYSVRRIVEEAKRVTPFKDNTPGKKWYYGFMKRNPIISEKKAEGVNKARAAVTEKSLRYWFAEVTRELELENAVEVLEDPSRVFNADESGFMLCPKSGKVLGPKGDTEDFYVIEGNNSKEQLTVMFTIRADGEPVPPMIIYPYVRVPRAVLDGIKDGDYGVGAAKKGWMNSETFFQWVHNHFLEYLKLKEIKRPVILFVDGHKSHLSLYVSELCKREKIILISLHPNSTHLLQPADVSVFGPLKKAWRSAVSDWLFENPKENFVTKITFASLLKLAIAKLPKSAVQNGFRTCGLFPFDPNALNYSKCIKNREAAIPQTPSHNEARRNYGDLLSLLEAEIGPNIVSSFNASKVWLGSRRYDALFKVWKSIKQKSSTTDEEIDATQTQQPSTSHVSDEEIEEQEVRIPQPPSTNLGLMPDESAEQDLAGAASPHNERSQCKPTKLPQYYISSPFKRCLKMPVTPVKGAKPLKEKPPVVVSSAKYSEYFLKKDLEKQEKEAKKRKKGEPKLPKNSAATKKQKSNIQIDSTSEDEASLEDLGESSGGSDFVSSESEDDDGSPPAVNSFVVAKVDGKTKDAYRLFVVKVIEYNTDGFSAVFLKRLSQTQKFKLTTEESFFTFKDVVKKLASPTVCSSARYEGMLTFNGLSDSGLIQTIN